ncbi:MAG: hypothetical protein AMXMBFR47_06190 [Planctomycetota bacterium]
MISPRILIVAMALFGSVVATVPADVIVLNDGSRLVGTIERLSNGRLKITTAYAKLEIDAAMIVSISSDAKVNVGTSTGDVFVGQVKASETSDSVQVHTAFGDIDVPVAAISAVWPEGGVSPEVEAVQEQVAAQRKEVEARVGKWGLTVEAGWLMKEGNKDLMNARGKLTAQKKSSQDLLKFYLSGEYAEDRDIRNAAEAKAGAYYEYLLTQRFYWFASLDLEYDEFENLDLRLVALTGPGFYWLKKETHELKTSLGAGYQHEVFMDDTRRDDAILQLAAGYRIDIRPWLRFTNDTAYYPTLESVNDYRLTNDAAVTIPIAASEIWKIKFGVLLEYDSIPRPDFQRLDTTYYANLVADFQ